MCCGEWLSVDWVIEKPSCVQLVILQTKAVKVYTYVGVQKNISNESHRGFPTIFRRETTQQLPVCLSVFHASSKKGSTLKETDLRPWEKIILLEQTTVDKG